MSNQLLSSKIAVYEEQPSVRPIQAATLSVTGAVGIAERGPINVKTLVTSFEEYLKIFGSYTANSDLTLGAKGFFEQGGVFLNVVRIVHLTDNTDPSTKTSAAATVNVPTDALADTAGTVLGANTGPYVLTPGATLQLSLDGGGTLTATFAATAAARDSATGTFALSNGQQLTLQIDGGSTQTITFSTSQFVSIGAATALEVAAVINAAISGASASVVTNKVRITSDKKGTGSSVNITGGTANTALAYTTGALAGTGNVANIAAVTVTEVVSVLAAAFTPAVITNDGGRPRITSNTLGGSSSVHVLTGGTTQTIFGFDTATHTGNSAGTLNTLRIFAKSDGVYGNNVSGVVSAATNGSAAYFNLSEVQNGRTVKTWPNVTMDDTSPDYVVDQINDVNNGSNLIQVEDLDAATSSPNDRPANGTYALSGGNDGLVGLTDADFTGSPVANAAAGTGLRALDTVGDLSILAVPGRATATVCNAMVTYCEATRFGTCFAVLPTPANQSATQMVTFVTSTASLKELTEFAAIYWPRIKIGNPSTAVYGTDTTVTIDPSLTIAGVYARNDGATPGGIYEAPAGVDFGKLLNVVGLETLEAFDEAKRDLVAPALINPIVGIEGQPIHIDGSDTLKTTGPFPTIGERRGAIFIEVSLKSGLIFAKHRKIKTSLLNQLKRTCTAFLLIQMRNGAFATDDAKTAFLVDFSPGLNPPSEAYAKRVNGRIGLATAKPAKYVVLRVGQDTRALEEELAKAA